MPDKNKNVKREDQKKRQQKPAKDTSGDASEVSSEEESEHENIPGVGNDNDVADEEIEGEEEEEVTQRTPRMGEDLPEVD